RAARTTLPSARTAWSTCRWLRSTPSMLTARDDIAHRTSLPGWTDRPQDVVMHEMSHNKQIVRRLFEEAFNHERLAVLDELVATEYADATGARGPGAFREVIGRLRGAFPDLRYTIDDVVAEGDRVAVRWHWSGTHQGTFRGVPPTYRSITNNGAAIFQGADAQIVAPALETDRPALPPPPPRFPPTHRLLPT